MAQYTSEKGLQKAVVKALRKRWPDAWIFHPIGHPNQESGIPDLLVCIEGKLIGIELKHQKPGESEEHVLTRVSPTQWFQINRIRKAGGTSGPAWSVEQAVDLVEEALAA